MRLFLCMFVMNREHTIVNVTRNFDTVHMKPKFIEYLSEKYLL